MSDPIDRKRDAREINRILKKTYPDAHCALHHSSALELLIATILSAQCTDERVNIVTATLFRKYRTCQDFCNAPILELEQDIRSTGFFRNKARSIQGTCCLLIERFGGKVPETLEELIQLPGVARKTANVVLGVAFGIPSGVVVDTHVERLSRRMGLTTEQRADKIEADLIALLPKSEWIAFSHRMIWHGRRICAARKPLCESCPVERLCPSSRLKNEPTDPAPRKRTPRKDVLSQS
ncbi:MAG: endonuclease III [Acidobacteriota bacterium]